MYQMSTHMATVNCWGACCFTKWLTRFFCEDHGIILIPCSKVMVHCLHTVITATSFKFLSLCTST